MSLESREVSSPPGSRRRYHVDSRILMVFLVAAVTAFAFLRLASEVAEGDTLAFDRALLRGLRTVANPAVPIGPAWLRNAMIDITALGSGTILTTVTLISAGYLIAARKVTTAAFLTAAIVGGAVASGLLKSAFLRPRPDFVEHLVVVQATSFPSGHAMNSAIIYITIGALLARSEESRSVRIYLVSVSIVLALLVGFSRVYLGVHWPSDVVAGWCIGAGWAVLCSLIARTLERRNKIDVSNVRRHAG